MFFKQLVGISLFFTCSYVRAGDTLVTAILKRIETLQNREDPYFTKGIFPCYRQYAFNKKRIRKDDNIFYAGLIGYIVNSHQNCLSADEKIISDTILIRIAGVAPKFRNRQGRNTYNFWPTDTLKIFPNSGWINWFDKSYALADDTDDTAIMLMVLNTNSDTVEQVHNLMQEFINKKSHPVHNTLKEYKKFETYSTWFGKKMVTEFDVCTIANILTMVQTYNLPWNAADSAGLNLLQYMIEHKDHLQHPDKLSVYYKNTPIILYHLSRLMYCKKISQLDVYKPQLIEEAKAAFNKSDNLVERIMLKTALLHWGYNWKEQPLILSENIITEVEKTHYPFFIANLACTMPKGIAYPFVNAGITKFYFHCPAFNLSLLLEYTLETIGK